MDYNIRKMLSLLYFPEGMNFTKDVKSPAKNHIRSLFHSEGLKAAL